jgi:hypothetical protein
MIRAQRLAMEDIQPGANSLCLQRTNQRGAVDELPGCHSRSQASRIYLFLPNSGRATMRSDRVLYVVIAVVFSTAAPPVSAATDAIGPCAEKARRIDAEIAQAKAKDNTRALANLERARADMVHCSDDGLREKRKMALEQAQHRIDQREADLKKAEASSDAAKIKKAQRNLESARKVYSEIESSPL